MYLKIIQINGFFFKSSIENTQGNNSMVFVMVQGRNKVLVLVED
jgi:hypothetical protein